MQDVEVNRRSFLKATASALAVGSVGAGAYAVAGDPVEVILGFGDDDACATAEGMAASVGRRFSFDAVVLEIPRNALAPLAALPGVRYVEPNAPVTVGRPARNLPSCEAGSGGTDSPVTAEQRLPWGVDRIDADLAWEQGATGAGANVAIVDTGIDPAHPDLARNVGEGVAVVRNTETDGGGGGDGDGAGEPWDDDNGHGTHVAGIAAAPDDGRGVVGVAPDATLHAVKIVDRFGNGSYADTAAGIEAVADRGWDVANVSVAGGQSAVVADAVQYAHEQGVAIVASARQECEGCVGYPAAETEVVAVNAVAEDDTLGPSAARGSAVELAAPGSAIYSSVPGGYATDSGTSMAAPHVTGAAALVIAEGASNVEARERLRTTAEDLGLADDEQGYGLVDAAAVVGAQS